MLDPGRFVRVHRSHIVNLDYVVAFTTDPKGALEVELRSGTKLSVSRAPGAGAAEPGAVGAPAAIERKHETTGDDADRPLAFVVVAGSSRGPPPTRAN